MKTSLMQPWPPFSGSIDPDARCWLCGMPAQCRHHVYPGNPNRSLSEREGCWAYLCNRCHEAVHRHERREVSGRGGVDLMLLMQETCQVMWMHSVGKTAEEFRAIFGKSYV